MRLNRFLDLIEELTSLELLTELREIMADLTRLQTAIEAQEKLIPTLEAKITAQAARITDLEAQLATAAGDQAAVDALAQRVETDNAALTQASA